MLCYSYYHYRRLTGFAYDGGGDAGDGRDDRELFEDEEEEDVKGTVALVVAVDVAPLLPPCSYSSVKAVIVGICICM